MTNYDFQFRVIPSFVFHNGELGLDKDFVSKNDDLVESLRSLALNDGVEPESFDRYVQHVQFAVKEIDGDIWALTLHYPKPQDSTDAVYGVIFTSESKFMSSYYTFEFGNNPFSSEVSPTYCLGTQDGGRHSNFGATDELLPMDEFVGESLALFRQRIESRPTMGKIDWSKFD